MALPAAREKRVNKGKARANRMVGSSGLGGENHAQGDGQCIWSMRS